MPYYFKGAEIERTGKIEHLHGADFEVCIYLDGHKKGEECHVISSHFDIYPQPKGTPMEDAKTFTIERDNLPDLTFKGELIASANGKGHQGDSQNRWWHYRLHKTTGGKFVCSKEYQTQWQGESGSFEAKVCDSEEEIVSYFGHDDLGKEIFEEACIDTAETVQ